MPWPGGSLTSGWGALAAGGWAPRPSGPSPGTSRRGRWSAGRRCPWRRTAGRRPAAPSARPAGPRRTAGARPAAGRSRPPRSWSGRDPSSRSSRGRRRPSGRACPAGPGRTGPPPRPAIPAPPPPPGSRRRRRSRPPPATSGVSRASDSSQRRGVDSRPGAGAQVAGRGRWQAARSPSWKEPAGTGARAAEVEHRTEGSRVEATLIGSTGSTRRLSRIPQPRTPRAVDSPARPPRRSATLPSGAPPPGGAARPREVASRGPACGRCSGGGGSLRGRGGGPCRPGSRRSCPRTR